VIGPGGLSTAYISRRPDPQSSIGPSLDVPIGLFRGFLFLAQEPTGRTGPDWVFLCTPPSLPSVIDYRCAEGS
jgi:hypothetical protein